MMSIAAVSEKGTSRATNQDACCACVARTELGDVAMAVVCDGVGGLASGELASTSVARWFSQWFASQLPSCVSQMTSDSVEGVITCEWSCLLHELNGTLCAYAEDARSSMGTTLTGLFVALGHYVAVQVGDSRLYRVDMQSCQQVTEDQTYVGQLVSRGAITREEAARHPSRHVITQAVGAQKILMPVFSAGRVATDDIFVLCTDGACHGVDNEELCRRFGGLVGRGEQDLARACSELLRDRMDCGETDNLTVACLAMGGEDPSSQTVCLSGEWL